MAQLSITRTGGQQEFDPAGSMIRGLDMAKELYTLQQAAQKQADEHQSRADLDKSLAAIDYSKITSPHAVTLLKAAAATKDTEQKKHFMVAALNAQDNHDAKEEEKRRWDVGQAHTREREGVADARYQQTQSNEAAMKLAGLTTPPAPTTHFLPDGRVAQVQTPPEWERMSPAARQAFTDYYGSAKQMSTTPDMLVPPVPSAPEAAPQAPQAALAGADGPMSAEGPAPDIVTIAVNGGKNYMNIPTTFNGRKVSEPEAIARAQQVFAVNPKAFPVFSNAQDAINAAHAQTAPQGAGPAPTVTPLPGGGSYSIAGKPKVVWKDLRTETKYDAKTRHMFSRVVREDQDGNLQYGEWTDQGLKFKEDDDRGDTVSGMSQEEIDHYAEIYNKTGNLPSLGMGKSPLRTAILKSAARKAKGLGKTGADVVSDVSDVKALQNALKENEKRLAASSGFSRTIDKNLELIEGLQKKYGSDFPKLINQARLYYQKKVGGSGDAASLLLAVRNTSTEIAKLTSGSLGNAEVSNAADNHMQEIFDASMRGEEMSKLLATAKQEGLNRVTSLKEESADIRKRISGGKAADKKSDPLGIR